MGRRIFGLAKRLLLRRPLGFGCHGQRGDIFVHPHVRELVNLQEVNGKTKPYQVHQLLEIVERYDLELKTGEES